MGSAYYGSIRDYILINYAAMGMMGLTTQATNIDARIAGLEAGIDYQINENWKIGSVLSYAYGKQTDSNQALPQMPPLAARVSITYDTGKHLSFGMLARIVSRQSRIALDQGNIVERDLGESAGFSTLALNAGYRLTPAWQLTAGIDNVFNRTYSEHLNLSGNSDFGYPADPIRINEPGRTLWLKLNYNYD